MVIAGIQRKFKQRYDKCHSKEFNKHAFISCINKAIIKCLNLNLIKYKSGKMPWHEL